MNREGSGRFAILSKTTDEKKEIELGLLGGPKG